MPASDLDYWGINKPGIRWFQKGNITFTEADHDGENEKGILTGGNYG